MAQKAKKSPVQKPKPAGDGGLPDEVKEFFFGSDSIKTKEQLRERNIDFMKRCAAGELKEGEQIRGGTWAQQLPKQKLRALLQLIFAYDSWSEKTDPSGTRGNGVVMFDGNYIMWAIREVDLTPPGMLLAESPRAVCLLVKHSSEI